MDKNRDKKFIKRTQWIINHGFQYRYIGVFLLAALLASLFVGSILSYIVYVNWDLQLQQGLSQFNEIQSHLVSQRWFVFGTFAAIFIVLAGLLSIWGLILSHRIAGPVYAISRRINSIVTDNDLLTPLKLRKNDALLEARDDLNITMKTLRDRMQQEAFFWDALRKNLNQIEDHHPELLADIKSITRDVDGMVKEKEKWVGVIQ